MVEIVGEHAHAHSGPSRGRAGPGTISRSGPVRNFKLYCIFLKGNIPNANDRGLRSIV